MIITNLKRKFKLYVWHYADRFLALLTRKFESVPPHTWDAIMQQQWLFSTRLDAQHKLGVKILYDEKNNKLVSKITRQVVK